MRNLKILLFFLINFFALFRLDESKAASNEWGNGGHGVACKSTTNTYYHLLDFVEADSSDIKLKAFDESSSVEEIGKLVLSELSRLAPQRAQRYQRLFDSILKTYQMTSPNTKLVISQDFGYVSIPKDCELVQLGMQINDHLTNKVTVVFQKESWAALDNMNKAGLIMHEVVLLDLASNEERHPTTQRARNFVGLLFSENLNQMTKRSFVETLSRLQFKFAEAGETEFALYNKLSNTVYQNVLEWKDDNTLLSFTWNGEFIYRKLLSFSCKSDSLKGKVRLDKNGAVGEVRVELNQVIGDLIKADCPILKFPYIDSYSFRGEIIAASYIISGNVLLEASRIFPFPLKFQGFSVRDKNGEVLNINIEKVPSYRLSFDKRQELKNFEVAVFAAYICGVYSDEYYTKSYTFHTPRLYLNGVWTIHNVCQKE